LECYLKSKEIALEELMGFVSNSVGIPEGPVQIGSLENLLKGSAFQKLAAHYYDAFQNNKMCFPYFNVD